MLTKNLLRFKKLKGTIKPLFISISDPVLLEFVEEALAFLKESSGMSALAIEEHLSTLVLNTVDSEELVLKGLVKLLLDRLEYASPKNDIAELRHQVFSAGSALEAESLASLQTYREKIVSSLQEKEAVTLSMLSQKGDSFLSEVLYGDLPEFRSVVSFKEITSENLLAKYNCALVQGLLLFTSSLSLWLPKTQGSAKLRELFKYLKFFQLIPFVETEKEHFKIVLDGPLNLFFESHKYGLSFANFFPALLNMPTWKLEAICSLKPGETLLLQLEQKSCFLALKPQYGHFNSFVPEEFQLFQKSFCEKYQDFDLQEAQEFLHFSSSQFCFPDFILQEKKTEKRMAIELFHPWHATSLLARLEQLEAVKDEVLPVILGVSRKLLKNLDFKSKIEASNYFNRRGFLFREMPTGEQLLAVFFKD